MSGGELVDAALSILVVDDEPAHAEAIRRAFEVGGKRTAMQVVGTLREYRAAVAAGPPDLALLDLNLPDGRAVEVLTSPPEIAPFPVLIMTSHGDEQVAVEAMRAGALDYIVKSPEAFRGMPHSVERALREWALRRARTDAEEALVQSEARTRAIYDHLPSPTFVWQRRGEGFVLAAFNEAARAVTRGAVAGFLGRSAAELPPGFAEVGEQLERCFQQRVPIKHEVDLGSPAAKPPRRIVATYGFIPPDMVLLHAEDVTAQRQMEEQLRMAQRMEAVGQLAGGVAHDFNNLLSVIIAYAEFAIAGVREGDPLRDDLEEIRHAGERAAVLTRQLLAFSRKQLLKPEVISLNKVVGGLESLLRRLIGEDVALKMALAADLGNVKADPGQIEQVVMNLAINSRDAMPRGGKITIETFNLELDEEYANQHVAVKPGPYVALTVTDTGCGMDERMKARVFEPFFTTKEKGKGTGLGLSTVYGIVKQSGGNVWVYSELGRGTTFKVYLPRELVAAETAEPSRDVAARLGGTETILLVEDEEAVRNLARRILAAAGYTVLTAANGGAALLTCERHAGPIHLVLTDVVMPQMSGRILADRLTGLRRDLKVLFMSGYTDNAIVHHGVLDPGTEFISKPFNALELTRKVRQVLDSPPPGASG